MRWVLRVISVILLIAWMGFIFCLSAQTAEVSSQSSGSVIEFIAEKIYPDFDELAQEEREEVISSFQFIARKSAHVGVFAVLSVLAFLVFISYTRLRFFTRIFWATAISIIYAASDEYHQRFVVGRSCELRDLLLDCAGIFAGIVICVLFVKIIRPLRRKTAYVDGGKKILEKLNDELNDKLDYTVARNESLENEIEEYKLKVEELQKELDCRAIEESATQQIEEMPNIEKVDIMEKIELSEEMKYAASVIGAAVVEVTKICNKLTEQQNQNSKDLVNLALGRNEVLKSEILKILSSDITFSEKKALIEKEKCEAYDYFNSIVAQTC